MNAALAYDPSLEAFRPVCQKITAFYIVERYPLIIDSSLTGEEVQEALEEVEALIEKLRKL